jgi:hypothetical protein
LLVPNPVFDEMDQLAQFALYGDLRQTMPPRPG